MYKSIINFLFFIKIHHSIKNLLILLPVFASHKFEIFFNSDWIFHFFYWCIFSQLSYFLNNYYDFNIDIKNKLKNIKYYLPDVRIIFFYFIFVIIIFLLEFNYILKIILFLYLFLNFIYTFFLKKIKFLNIITITLFFLLRLLYGTICFDIILSFFFLFFMSLIFFYLALNKRVVEIIYNSKTSQAFTALDINKMNYIYYISFFFSLLVFIFYILSNYSKIYYINNYILFINLIIYIGIFINYTYKTINTPYLDVVIFLYKDKTNFILLLLFSIFYFINIKFS